MKYVPLDSQPNVSVTRFSSVSPSMKLDDREYPHIAWLDIKAGHNEVRYSYWDGLKWAYYSDDPVVYVSKDEVTPTPNSLVLDSNNNPVIVFARRSANGTILSLASYYKEWNFNELDVGYNVGWVGVVKFEGEERSSSFSSSSVSSSSSSSMDSNSSSSSSSLNDANYFVVAYDDINSQFYIYAVTDAMWRLAGTFSEDIGQVETIKIDSCGREIGIAAIYDDITIKYNFFDIDTWTWAFSSFNNLSVPTLYGSLIDMSFAGYERENQGIMSLSWLSRSSVTFYLISMEISDTGSETPTNPLSPVVESSSINVSTSLDYIVNGYNLVDVTVNSSNIPYIFVTGATSKLFYFNPNTNVWNSDLIDMEVISGGIVPLSFQTAFAPNSLEIKVCISSDSGDIYYLENDSGAETFPMTTPDIMVLNKGPLYHATYQNGALAGVEISGTTDNICGAILKDTERPILIIPDDNSSSSSSSMGYSLSSSSSSSSSSP